MKKTDGFISLRPEQRRGFFRSLYLRQRAADCGRTGAGDTKSFLCRRTGLWNSMPNETALLIPWRARLLRGQIQNILASTMFLCACFFTGQTAPSRDPRFFDIWRYHQIPANSPASRRSPHPTQFILAPYRGGMIYEGTDCGR